MVSMTLFLSLNAISKHTSKLGRNLYRSLHFFVDRLLFLHKSLLILKIENGKRFSFRDISLNFDQFCCALEKVCYQTSGCQNVYRLWWQMKPKTNKQV